MQQLKETKHSRTQFQIDRIAFFSDAVIAIAITLMILEIKIPELGKDVTFSQILKQYTEGIVLHILALLIGFFAIGNLWIRHHELFEHITNYNKKLVKFNLYFLFTVMLLPITISFLFTKNEPPQLQKLFYFFNLFLCSLSYSLILVVIFHKKNNFSMLTDKREINKMKISALAGTIVLFLVVIFVIFAEKWFYVPFVLVPIARFISKKIAKASERKIKPVIHKE